MLKKYLTIAVLLFGSLLTVCRAQENNPPQVAFDLPKFYMEQVNFPTRSADSTRLDIYLQVPYEMVSFVRGDEDFKASYDVTVNIFDSSGALIVEKLWTEKLESQSYDESISKHAGNISQKSFILAPAMYDILVQVRDNETKKIAQIRRTIRVRRFPGHTLAVSDLIIVASMEQEGEKIAIVPNVSGFVNELVDGVSFFFEAYNHASLDSGIFFLTIRNLRGDTLQIDTLRKALSQTETACFIKIRNEKISVGEYEAYLQAKPLGLAATATTTIDSGSIASHLFAVRWKRFPAPIHDLDAAIDEMQYVSDRETIENMKKADSVKRRDMFFDFWKKRDPTPGTDANELMEEYYSRVDYSNKNFGHYQPGWRTDRGMVYIIFGTPSNIERRPFDIDSKPYEVWTYYEQNRQFVFIDQTGFGDYRLQSPIWDVGNTRYH